MDDKPLTPKTDDSLEGLLDAFRNLDLETKNTFTNFYRTDDMTEVAPTVKKTELNLPRIFTGKRTDLQRFLQDTFVFLTINKEHYNNNDKKIAFVISFMTDGDAALWKEEFIGKVIRDSVARGDNIFLGHTRNSSKVLKNCSLHMTHLETPSMP